MSSRASRADLLISGGPIWTGVSTVEALAVRHGRVLAAGNLEELGGLAGPDTRRLDLDGRTAIPGFHDAHIHIWKVGHLLTSLLDLRKTASLRQLDDALRHKAEALPGAAWLLGRGYNEASLAEGRGPVRGDLDAAAPGRLVFLTRTCGHVAVASSRALELAGVDVSTPDPPGGRIERDAAGTPTGVLQETAMDLVSRHVPQPTPAEHSAMILSAARRLLSLGITSATEAGVPPALLEVYRGLDRDGRLPCRIDVMALRHALGGTEVYPLPEPARSDRLRIDCVKLVADGGLSGGTAALRCPYAGSHDRGVCRLDAGALYELALPARRAGLGVATHAIGDAAIDEVLTAYRRLAELVSGPVLRLEHFGLPDREQIELASRLGAIAVPQAIFIRDLGANFRRLLPPELLDRAYPIREMIESPMTVALSSDAPVVADENPLSGLQAAILRRDAEGLAIGPDQAISIDAALSAYTRGGAAAAGDLANRGTLEPGKWADLALLSGNPFETAPEELTALRVEATLVGGELVHGS